MTTTNKKFSAVLEKLDKALGKKRESTSGRIDFKELKELREKSFIKLKPGRNDIAILPKDVEDPFTFWGFHNSLQEVSYYSVPCDAYNKNKNCLICNIVADLKAENEIGNRNLWYPIRQQIEFYVPVIHLESEATIKQGARWLRFGKSIMSQFKGWIDNTEDDEEAFYSLESPQKVIVTYNNAPGTAPGDMYKLDKKNMKPFTAQQIADWHGNLRPVSDFIFSKSQEEIKKIADGYFERIEHEVAPQIAAAAKAKEVDVEEDDDEDTAVETVTEVPSKLDFLKKKK